MSLAERRKAKALEEAVPALAVKLNARSTRGQRISDLQGEDAEADETFWGQGAFQEADESDFSSEEGAVFCCCCADSLSVCVVGLRARVL